jgi:hypothetical protein
MSAFRSLTSSLLQGEAGGRSWQLLRQFCQRVGRGGAGCIRRLLPSRCEILSVTDEELAILKGAKAGLSGFAEQATCQAIRSGPSVNSCPHFDVIGDAQMVLNRVESDFPHRLVRL